MTGVVAVDPRTGAALSEVAVETTADEVAAATGAAASAFPYLSGLSRTDRAALLRALAEGLEIQRSELVTVADSETALGDARLNGELTRTVFQLRFFAEVIEEGSYLEATIDHAGSTAMGYRHDLRQVLVATGPVAVFGASNFPFAFSVPGGDTASALAAGCPVVVKAHPSHPGTSRLAYETMRDSALAFGAPDGILRIVYGQQAGIALVQAPGITAVSFTGSLGGGKALMAAVNARPDPVPFYGELSSINPMVITRPAAALGAAKLGSRLAAAIGGSAGQLCTKPGLIFVPVGEAGDAVVSATVEALGGAQVPPLLNERIFDSYAQITDSYANAPGVTALIPAAQGGAGFLVTPTLYTVNADELRAETVHEIFGPASLIVRYDNFDELAAALNHVENSLTATVHLAPEEETETAQMITALLVPRAGRILYNSYPTGLAVSWAQTHGGPWPSTNTMFSSVGATAIRRFLRPVTYQNAPQAVLPDELRDKPTTVPRREDGRLVLPQTTA
jgi:NADP-dependent aldehyde dehydrogenase